MRRKIGGNLGFRQACAATFVFGALLSSGAGARAEEQGIWEREKLTGDWGGARTAWEEKGVEVGIEYIGEVFSVLSGGLRRGTTYEGRLDVSVDTDLEKLVGWKGGKTHVRLFQIHNSGRNVAENVGSIADPSNIDALPTTRLFTAWFEQDFGRFSIRAGQLAADDEFLVSDTAGGLLNGTFGWATIMSANLPSGGAAYPLATPGVRLQVNPAENLSFLAAAFSGDPAGRNCSDDPQICNRHGTTFSFSGGAFLIGEAQVHVNQEEDAKGLAAAYKIGAWYHTGNFADQRYGIDGTGAIVSLATAPDDALYHSGNWGMYAVVDRMIWRAGERSTSIFVRGGVSPSNRNLLSWYIDGGIGFKGLIPSRADDTLTVGVAYSRISKAAIALDQDTLALSGPPYPIRNAETVFELSYVAQLAPWWTLQSDLQYIVRPGGNVPDPDDPSRTVGNAFVVGLRSTITY
ncbi:MAG: carbohydrate porin [Bradyrhizobiaceae bacterium]|nr:carbohydrate porin [Bradyrhizobiaceae bacterium]